VYTEQVQAKVNTYLAFVLKGQMQQLYPESAGKAIRIELHRTEAPDEEQIAFCALLGKEAKKRGIAFAVEILEP